MYYVKLVLYFAWMILYSFVMLFYAALRWKSPVLNMHYAHGFSAIALKLIGIKVNIENPENLTAHAPCILMANHQSGLDVAVSGPAVRPHMVVIGKKELIWVPLFGFYFWAAGNVMIDRKKRTKAISGLDEAVHAIKTKGDSIWIFPEGTRNRSKDPLLPFKKGGFYMAVEAQVPIVPIVISPLKPLVDTDQRRIRPGTITIRVLPPISTLGKTDQDIPALMEQTRNEMLKTFASLPTIPK